MMPAPGEPLAAESPGARRPSRQGSPARTVVADAKRRASAKVRPVRSRPDSPSPSRSGDGDGRTPGSPASARVHVAKARPMSRGASPGDRVGSPRVAVAKARPRSPAPSEAVGAGLAEAAAEQSRRDHAKPRHSPRPSADLEETHLPHHVRESRAACWYGESCYNHKTHHRAKFSHPGDWDYPSDQKSPVKHKHEAHRAPSPTDVPKQELGSAASSSLRQAGVDHGGGGGFMGPAAESVSPAWGNAVHAVRERQPALQRPQPRSAFEEAESAPSQYVKSMSSRSIVSVARMMSSHSLYKAREKGPGFSRSFFKNFCNESTAFVACVCGGCTCLGLLIFIIVVIACHKFINVDEQLLVKTMSGKYTRDGPFSDVIWPHMRVEIRKATRIGQHEFAILKDNRTQMLRHQAGPGLVFLGPYEAFKAVKNKTVLRRDEYIRLVGLTGTERVVEGPQVIVAEPLEEAPKGVERAVIVNATATVCVENKTSGMRRIITEKGMFMPSAYEVIVEWRHALGLEPMMFAVVRDGLTGDVRNEGGPQLFFKGPYDEILKIGRRSVLEKGEYMRLVNNRTGVERIVQGPAAVMPEPTDFFPDGILRGVSVNADSALLVLNVATGQRYIAAEPGVFIPSAYERVLERRTKLQVLPHQAMLSRDITGRLHLHSHDGGTGPVSYFLGPYSKLIEIVWSSYEDPNAQEPAPKMTFDRIDLRVHKQFFKFEVRTQDNVALWLEGSTFWQVKDVLRMVQVTSDAPGDVFQRARNALLASVAKVELNDFLKHFRAITIETSNNEKMRPFYANRGLELHSFEVVNYECVDPRNQQTLHSIIAQTTSGLVQMEKALSEADVKKEHLRSQIDLEQKRADLIKARAHNAMLEAQSAGRTQGSRKMAVAQVFLDTLNDTGVVAAERAELYRINAKLQNLNTITENLIHQGVRSFVHAKDISLSLQ